MTEIFRVKKCDRRVVKTKRAIRNAFIRLLTEKDFNEITVKNIADEADVDRKTLYNYYGNIYEIREEFEKELAERLEHAIRELDFVNNIKNPQRIFEILTDIIDTDIELYSYLMKMDAHSHAVRKINDVLKNRLCKVMEESKLIADVEDIAICAEYVTSGLLSVYQSWFNSDRKIPLHEVSAKAGRLVLYGLKEFAVK